MATKPVFGTPEYFASIGAVGGGGSQPQQSTAPAPQQTQPVFGTPEYFQSIGATVGDSGQQVQNDNSSYYQQSAPQQAAPQKQFSDLSQDKRYELAALEPQNAKAKANSPKMYRLAEWVAKHHGIDRGLQNAASIAGPIDTAFETVRAPELAGGALQGTYGMVKSILDLPLSAVGQELPEMHAERAVRSDPLSQVAFQAGKLAPELAGNVGAYRLAGKIPALASKGLAASVGKGALSAYALGEDQPGGRTGAALIGGATGPLSDLGATRVADSVIDTKNALKDKYATLYSNLFQKIDAKGVTSMRVPKMDVESIRELSGASKHLKSLNAFTENPTFENAQAAQSDLGKLIANANPFKLTDTQLAAREEAIRARMKIRGAGYTALKNNGAEDLAKEYNTITKGYAKEVTPYSIKPISAYEKGNLKASSLASKLVRNDEFMLKAGKEAHPELQRRVQAKAALQKLAKVGLYGGLGALIYKKGGGSDIDNYVNDTQQ